MKDIDEYSKWTVEKWFLPHQENSLSERDLAIMALGLAGEAGEVIEIMKKIFRDGRFDKEHLKSELGDVIYYWARICEAMEFLPSDIIKQNIEKLNRPRINMSKDELGAAVVDKILAFGNGTMTDDLECAQDIINMVLNSGVKK